VDKNHQKDTERYMVTAKVKEGTKFTIAYVVSGNFLFFEHVHPEKVLKNNCKSEMKIWVELILVAGDTREKRARERDMNTFCGCAMADNIFPGR
jgi:hypothetical protein